MILFLIKYFLKRMQRYADWRNIQRLRKGFDKLSKLYSWPNKKCRYEPFQIDGMEAEWIIPVENPDTDRVLLYFHGGGYAAGSIATHRQHISHLVKVSRMRALMINYRLAPENKYPAPIEDAVKAYQWLLDNGYRADRIAFGGDSAGGGLTVGTLLYLKDHHKPLPKCAICMSPWLDLTLSGESHGTKEKEDPMLVKEAFPLWVKNYLGDTDTKTPYASPIYGDLHGLPPIYIQVGTAELLMDDSVMFAKKAQEAGSPVTIDIYKGHFHVFQAFFLILWSARSASKKLADFMVGQIGA